MGQLLILCGPSTSGKTTISNLFPLKPLVSITTRPKREGEIDGVHYHFLSPEEFDRLDKAGEIPEKTVYAGVKYGIFKRDIEEILTGVSRIAVLDAVGIRFMQDYIGRENVKAVYIGVTLETMKKRLLERGSKEEEINRRISQALEKELTPEYRAVCDAEIWNEGSIDESITQLTALLNEWNLF
ncbi:guanylate kinase [Neobacillus sp. YIM B02564]|uniref:Guanylate kinase n=1 Tax=Neobacillus paridis TaxID=2803862 RepID=A0ABS1TN84_9BACI|nr:guanylate kinase [Neobacillus paridis]MBL4952048.1 guanylate kinase [Neobacillus paridis]